MSSRARHPGGSRSIDPEANMPSRLCTMWGLHTERASAPQSGTEPHSELQDMSPLWSPLLADYQTALEFSTAAVAAIIIVLGLDDLFVDAWYWCRELYRTLTA